MASNKIPDELDAKNGIEGLYADIPIACQHRDFRGDLSCWHGLSLVTLNITNIVRYNIFLKAGYVYSI
jgi:hypothetical protein